MIEFYLILSAVQHDISSMMFYRLLIGTVLMLAFGYLGETSMLPAWGGFGLGQPATGNDGEILKAPISLRCPDCSAQGCLPPP